MKKTTPLSSSLRFMHPPLQYKNMSPGSPPPLPERLTPPLPERLTPLPELSILQKNNPLLSTNSSKPPAVHFTQVYAGGGGGVGVRQSRDHNKILQP